MLILMKNEEWKMHLPLIERVFILHSPFSIFNSSFFIYHLSSNHQFTRFLAIDPNKIEAIHEVWNIEVFAATR